MNDFKKIMKEEFLTAYNNHLPSKWVIFSFKYFSNDTLPENEYVKKWTKIILIVLFFLLMIGGILELPMSFMIYPIIIYSATIFGIVINMMTCAFVNNLRIKKIVKELNITLLQYDVLAKKYIK